VARLQRVANGQEMKSSDTEEVNVTNQTHFFFLPFPVSCFPGKQTRERKIIRQVVSGTEAERLSNGERHGEGYE